MEPNALINYLLLPAIHSSYSSFTWGDRTLRVRCINTTNFYSSPLIKGISRKSIICKNTPQMVCQHVQPLNLHNPEGALKRRNEVQRDVQLENG